MLLPLTQMASVLSPDGAAVFTAVSPAVVLTEEPTAAIREACVGWGVSRDVVAVRRGHHGEYTLTVPSVAAAARFTRIVYEPSGVIIVPAATLYLTYVPHGATPASVMAALNDADRAAGGSGDAVVAVRVYSTIYAAIAFPLSLAAAARLLNSDGVVVSGPVRLCGCMVTSPASCRLWPPRLHLRSIPIPQRVPPVLERVGWLPHHQAHPPSWHHSPRLCVPRPLAVHSIVCYGGRHQCLSWSSPS